MNFTLRVTSTLYGQVDREMFLDAINSGEVFVSTHKAWNHFLVRKGRRPWRRPPTPLAYQKATEAFRTLLRHYIDEWIDTGRAADGMESPADRGLGESERPHAPKVLEAASGATGVLHVVFKNEGGLEVFFCPYKAGCSLRELAKREAARYCAWFIASDWRNTVVKCRKLSCGRYFAIKNTRHLYKRGTYCRHHSSEKSAEAVTKEKRQRKRTLLQQLAVTAVEQHQKLSATDKKEHVLKYYVADYVNQRTPAAMKSIAPKSPITGKWVTRNLTQILDRQGSE
jgi:hypothetical protein